MSQPPPPPPPSLPSSNISRPASDMTETQKLPHFSPPGFLDYPHRRLPPPVQLPPLDIPPDAVPPRTDYQFRSPINQLPSIHPGPPPRHEHYQPSVAHRSAAPVEKLLLANPYTPPRSDPPYSPQQYGPSISPRSEFDSRGPGPRRLTEQRYPYEEPRHIQHHPHHEQSYSSLTSPVEPSQQRSYGPIPSPGYTPSYASSSTPFRGSIGSHPQSQRGSIAAPLGSVAYPESSASGPPPRKQRAIPLPGSIPQPVYNEQL